MEKALKIYAEVLRLVRRLPKDSQPYYAKYARENFVNYREVKANDDQALHELFLRAYNHCPQQVLSGQICGREVEENLLHLARLPSVRCNARKITKISRLQNVTKVIIMEKLELIGSSSVPIYVKYFCKVFTKPNANIDKGKK